jgi:excisionase family DNA binding protein
MKGPEQLELFETEELLDINELSHLLGVPKSWIYERTRQDEIPHIKLGKYLRFKMSEIREWLKTCERGMIK